MSISATYSVEDNKIRIYASQRLDAETYERVKAAGFAWAPKQDLFVAPRWTPQREDLALALAGEIDPEEMTIADRAIMKAERLDGLASKRARDANAYQRRADSLSEAFAFGQPILVGHHSERKARKTQERMHSAMDAAGKATRAANYWLYRAEGVEHYANMKNSARTRAGRIKTLLAELRDMQRDINAAHRALDVWQKCQTGDLIRLALGRLPHDQTLSTYDTYSAVDNGTLSPQDARLQCIDRAERTISSDRTRRWIAHTLNRLSFEREMLGIVPRYAGPLTPVILQAFAREHGAEKPVATKGDADSFVLESPVPLPLHIADGRTLELTADEWRDLMQSVGYEVPEKRDALPPILNIDAAAIAAMPIGRGYDARVSPVFRVTKAEYSAIPTDYRGVRLSACGTFRFKIGLACFVPSAKDSGLSRHAYVALFVTDSKAHDMPESTAITAHAGVVA